MVSVTNTDRNSYRANLTALRGAQKSPRGTAAYSRHINRPVARHVAAVLHRLGLTPNQATAISALLSATGLIMLAALPPTLVVGVAIAVLLAAGYVLDSVDGQLARLRGGGSLSGEMLDHTIDCVKTVSYHLAVLISLARFPPAEDQPGWVLLPLGFQVVDVLIYFGVVTMPLLRKIHQGGATPPYVVLKPEHPLRRWILLPTDYGVFCWIFVFRPWPGIFLAVYAAMFIINLLVLPLVLRKWWRELRSMDGLA